MQLFQDIFLDTCSTDQANLANPIMLAFIGDAVHTLFVRDAVVKTADLLIKDYHLKAAKRCRAASQAQLLDLICDNLTEQEKNIVRRARNAKTHHIAKNADIETYKKATSFEALVGYLYLIGNFERLKQIFKMGEQNDN